MQNNKFRVGDRVFLRTARIYADIVDVLDADNFYAKTVALIVESRKYLK